MAENQETPESELLVRSQKKDLDVFGELVERYSGTVYNVVARMVGDQADVDDLVQETFVAAFKALAGFRADSRFSTWLYRIAVNKSKDWLRSQSRKSERLVAGTQHESEADPLSQVPDHHTPESFLETKELGDQLDQAILALPELYREAFILKHVEGLDYEEMSSILNVNRDTLKMRVYKARTQLSRELAWMRES